MIFTLFSSNSVISICITSSTKTHYGAGSENRTRATRSEAWDSTTKLYPHQHIHYTTKITHMQTKNQKQYYQKLKINTTQHKLSTIQIIQHTTIRRKIKLQFITTKHLTRLFKRLINIIFSILTITNNRKT